jgi:hypothetical protein
MFKNNTVFVLGAGASWHYGYPTGEKLVDAVIGATNRFANYCENRDRCGQIVQLIPKYVEQRFDQNRGANGALEGWRNVQQECRLLIERLEAVQPVLIDHFLAWNESLQAIGKLMIAAVILECEAVWLKLRGNQNRQQRFTPGPIPRTASDVDVRRFNDAWCRFIVHKLVYGCVESADLLKNNVHFWPAPGSEDTELGVFMGPEVSHGATTVYTRVQA